MRNTPASDASWMAREQKAMMAKPQQHIAAMQNHMSAAQNSVSANDHDGAAYHLGAAATHGMAAGEHYATHSKHWIQNAIKHPGSFSKAAKKAHETVAGFAASVKAHPEKHSAKTLKRANLAQTLGKLGKGK